MLFSAMVSPGLVAPSLAPRASSALRSRAGASRAKAVASWLAEVDEKGVEYVGSYGTPREMPFLPLPEICLAGRSNVGKSSCLNALSGRRKKVAVASKQPGRTRLLNLFRVGRACAITPTSRGTGSRRCRATCRTAGRRTSRAT